MYEYIYTLLYNSITQYKVILWYSKPDKYYHIYVQPISVQSRVKGILAISLPCFDLSQRFSQGADFAKQPIKNISKYAMLL